MSNKFSLIEDRFNSYQDALVLQQADLSLKSISDMVDSKAIDINPKYQRRKRWTNKKESDLIESFILNIPVPPIYLAEEAYGIYSVIDGKQRITSINNFLNGKIKLGQLEEFTELEGLYFDDLPPTIKNALSIRPYLRVVTLLKQSNSDLKYEVFLRLNKSGVPLNSQEIRNTAFRGKLNDLLLELSENNEFKKILKIKSDSKIYREMVDVQYVLRFFTVVETWENFPGNMDIAMDSFMKNHYLDNDESIDHFRNCFLRALNGCISIWGYNSFTKPNSTKRVLQGFYDIQMVCLAMLNDEELANAIDKKERVQELLVAELRYNDRFSNSVSQFTSNPRNMSFRIETFYLILKSV